MTQCCIKQYPYLHNTTLIYKISTTSHFKQARSRVWAKINSCTECHDKDDFWNPCYLPVSFLSCIAPCTYYPPRSVRLFGSVWPLYRWIVNIEQSINLRLIRWWWQNTVLRVSWWQSYTIHVIPPVTLVLAVEWSPNGLFRPRSLPQSLQVSWIDWAAIHARTPRCFW